MNTTTAEVEALRKFARHMRQRLYDAVVPGYEALRDHRKGVDLDLVRPNTEAIAADLKQCEEAIALGPNLQDENAS